MTLEMATSYLSLSPSGSLSLKVRGKIFIKQFGDWEAYPGLIFHWNLIVISCRACLCVCLCMCLSLCAL